MSRGRLLFGLLFAAASCSMSAKDYGRQLLDDPGVSTAASNAFRCSNCHEAVATPAHLRTGYTLYDVVHRQSWWGGFELTLLVSINECVHSFMRGNPLSPTDDKARALLAYLESISPDATTPGKPITIIQNIVDVPSGDAASGKRLYDDGCVNCHGQPNTGAGRISDKASRIPAESIQMHGTDPKTGARVITIEKIRHGNEFGVGGNMAPYATEILSDAQVGDILAYMETVGLNPYTPPATP